MKKKSYIYMATDYDTILKIGHTTALSVRKSQLKKFEGLDYFREFEFNGDRPKRELYESLLRYAIESRFSVEAYKIDHFATDYDTIRNIDFEWDNMCQVIVKEETNIRRAFLRKIDAKASETFLKKLETMIK